MEKVSHSNMVLHSLAENLKFSNDFTLDMITLAARSCTAVLEGRVASRRTEKMAIKRLDDITSIRASSSGSMRATLVRLDPAAQTLVIAFRGTKLTSPVDWLVNANANAVSSNGVCIHPSSRQNVSVIDRYLRSFSGKT